MLHLCLGLRVAMVTVGRAGIASGDHTPSMVIVSVTEPSRRCSMQSPSCVRPGCVETPECEG